MSFDYHGVHGPDISFYQDANSTPQKIDFAKMKAAGASFVIIRAGQNTWPDEDFAYNYAKAKEAGLVRGVYWFYDSRATPVYQARLCASMVAGDLPEMGMWLDLEENYGGSYRGPVNWRICLDELKKTFPQVGIYTAPVYWFTNRPIDTQSLNYFASFPLWIANYGVTYPTIPSPWTSIVLWQWGTPSVGIEYGAESIEIDMNKWNGTPAEFTARYGVPVTELPPTEEPMPLYYKVTAAELNARSTGAFVADGSNVVGKLLRDDIVQADEPVNGWRRIHAIYRNNAPVTLPASPTGQVWVSGAYLIAAVFVPPVVTPPAGLPVLRVTLEADGYPPVVVDEWRPL